MLWLKCICVLCFVVFLCFVYCEVLELFYNIVFNCFSFSSFWRFVTGILLLFTMKNLKCGLVCAARGCRNKSYSCKKSFFRFPLDSIRARKWAIASNREDLLPKIHDLFKGYRLCGDHFDTGMFRNENCDRLKSDAVPTIFPSLEGSSKSCFPTVDHTYSRPPLIHLDSTSISLQESSRNISVLQDVLTTAEIPELEVQVDSEPVYISSDLLSPDCSTLTSSTSSSNIPRKMKYRERLKSLKTENKLLKMKIRDLEHKLENVEESVTFSQYQALSHHFAGSSEVACFVNFQMRQSRNKTNPFYR